MDRRFLMSGLAAALAACVIGGGQAAAQGMRGSGPNNLIVNFKRQGKARDQRRSGEGPGGPGAGGRGRFGGRGARGRMRRRMRMMRMRRRMMMQRWRGVYG